VTPLQREEVALQTSHPDEGGNQRARDRAKGRRRHEVRGGLRYFTSRLAQGLIVIFGAITISFFLIHLTGNPAEVIAGGILDPKQVHELSERLGYERPLMVQYLDYLGHVVRGNLGTSIRYQEPAAKSVFGALPYTLILVGGAIVVACTVALPIAIFSVRRRESMSDRVLRSTLIMGQGTPEYWLGVMLVLVFAVQLGWLPSIGYSGFASIILPILTLAIPPTAMLVRLLRANLLDVMNADFVVALRAKGLTENEILLRHGVRNSLASTLTFLALEIGWLVGGTIIVETVFVWPGIGSLALSAVAARDLPVIQAIMIVVAVSYVLLNFAVDAAIFAIDPRVRSGRVH
jgi:peptide/nickel transport system permease protein